VILFTPKKYIKIKAEQLSCKFERIRKFTRASERLRELKASGLIRVDCIFNTFELIDGKVLVSTDDCHTKALTFSEIKKLLTVEDLSVFYRSFQV
jgi:hypothetical protein